MADLNTPLTAQQARDLVSLMTLQVLTGIAASQPGDNQSVLTVIRRNADQCAAAMGLNDLLKPYPPTQTDRTATQTSGAADETGSARDETWFQAFAEVGGK